MRENNYVRKNVWGNFSQEVPPQKLRFLINSILATCANDHNRAFSLGNAQDCFALFALEIEVCFAVAPNIAAEFEKVLDAVFDFEVTVQFSAALVKPARKGAKE